MNALIGALALTLAAQGAAIAQTSPAPGPAVQMHGDTITLAPAGKKTPAGSATLAQQDGGGLIVALSLPQGYQPARAAIFSGTCDGKSSAAMSPDQPVAFERQRDGRHGEHDQLISKPHVIVVLGTPALCGDIKP